VYPGPPDQPGYPSQIYQGYPPAPGVAPYGQPYYPAPTQNTSMAVISHLGPLAGGFLVPLIVLAITKDDPFTRRHANEALNFQLTIFGAAIAGMACVGLAMAVDFRALLLVFPLVWLSLFGITIFAWVVSIMAMLRASRGEEYRYPLTVRLVQP
jgi:uncharacterized Tic20 family protein